MTALQQEIDSHLDLEDDQPEENDVELQQQGNEVQSQKMTTAVNHNHKKYGNMVVFCEKPFLISIGPDYWCFIPAFLIFSVLAYFIIKFVSNHSTNFWFITITYLICGGFILSYLVLALSNPGIVTQSEVAEQQQQKQIKEGKSRQCKKCNIKIKKKTRHCYDCGVCIEEYDHHCPWTSKCIGKNNLCKFYIFLGMVPTFLIYTFVAFSVVMASMPHERYNMRKSKGHL